MNECFHGGVGVKTHSSMTSEGNRGERRRRRHKQSSEPCITSPSSPPHHGKFALSTCSRPLACRSLLVLSSPLCIVLALPCCCCCVAAATSRPSLLPSAPSCCCLLRRRCLCGLLLILSPLTNLLFPHPSPLLLILVHLLLFLLPPRGCHQMLT